MTRQCNAPQRSGGVSILVCCLLATIQCITAAMAAAITRELTSESNVISADILEFHLRSDLKIKQTCPDLNYILAPLHNADADGNGVLNQEEFVVFADVVSGGYLTETNRAGSFSEIPLALQNAYLVLSCSCEFFQSEPWGGKGCCTVSGNGLNDLNGIRTNGTAPGETLTTNERRYLTNVCGTMTETLDSIGAGLVSPPPTGRPTIPPTTMSPTSRKPTSQPSKAPTEQPTQKPTGKPTMMPVTPKPTNKPSKKPVTEKPTITPTQAPTPSPQPMVPETVPPTFKPTADVTAIDTIRPTPVRETKSPTESPMTYPPTLSPATSFPTLNPSEGSTMLITETLPPVTSSPVVTSAPPSPSPSEPPASVLPTTKTKSPSLSIVPTTEIGSKSPSAAEPGQTMSPSAVEPPTAGKTISPSLLEQPTATETKSPSSIATNLPESNASTAPTTSTSSRSPTPQTSKPSSEAVSNPFTGVIPIALNFTQSLQGKVTAKEIMDGEDNQVKVMLEESLLELSEIVIAEEFGNSSSQKNSDRRLVLRKTSSRRYLVVIDPTNATILSAKDVECPNTGGGSSTPQSMCLDFNSTILLPIVNETDRSPETISVIFQNAMYAKIEEGWLTENFNLTKALEPPLKEPAPAPSPSTDGTRKMGADLSTGAIIGIAVGGTLMLYLVIAMIYYAGKRNSKPDDEFDLERPPVSESAGNDLAPVSPDSSRGMGDSWSLDDASEAQTESNTSQDHLLPEHISSSAEPVLGKIDDEEDWSESDINSSAYDSSTVSSGPAQDLTAGSSLAAVGMASTFVASTNVKSGTGKSKDSDESGGSGGTVSVAESSAGDGSRGLLGAESSDNRFLSAGDVSAIGAAGVVTAGALAAGAYAATRTPKNEEGTSSSSEEADITARASDPTPLSNLDDLDSAIDAGNWGAVGALAAILASRGAPPKKEPRSVASTRSGDSSARSGSRDSTTGPTLDQARAAEIDKLVEAGDWQGVVLAAARFEADQTMDGESYSASASRSSYRSGSAQSTATPKSLATSGQSSTNIGSGRSQAEIKAEVEALVRRVVPEEADNVDEMLTQFKGREEGML
ncbi:hypothetical protein ACHAWX_005440 [Stephanocyclus meneghinianus]